MPPVSLLFLPPAALSDCLFAAIFRDTRGVALSDADRFNHFPAAPLVSVTWVMDGQLDILSGAQAGRVVDAARPYLVAGPSDRPTTSWSAGPVRAVTFGIYPDAWRRLGGDAGCVVAPDPICAALRCFAPDAAPDHRWQAACATMLPAWQTTRPGGSVAVARLSAWARGAMAHAALSSTGRSLRAFERALKRTSGQTRRSLDHFSAIESLHQMALAQPGASLAAIAQAAGFADQSHMGRAVRRATGLSPARLNRAIRADAAFWCYRLLGERF